MILGGSGLPDGLHDRGTRGGIAALEDGTAQRRAAQQRAAEQGTAQQRACSRGYRVNDAAAVLIVAQQGGIGSCGDVAAVGDGPGFRCGLAGDLMINMIVEINQEASQTGFCVRGDAEGKRAADGQRSLLLPAGAVAAGNGAGDEGFPGAAALVAVMLVIQAAVCQGKAFLNGAENGQVIQKQVDLVLFRDAHGFAGAAAARNGIAEAAFIRVGQLFVFAHFQQRLHADLLQRGLGGGLGVALIIISVGDGGIAVFTGQESLRGIGRQRCAAAGADDLFHMYDSF